MPRPAADALTSHLQDCPNCARQVDDFKRAIEAVASVPPELASSQRRSQILDLVFADQEVVKNEEAAKNENSWRPSFPMALGLAGGALAVALGVVLFVRAPSDINGDSGFQARGPQHTPKNGLESSMVGIRIFRIGPTSPRPVRVHEKLIAGERLLFSYSNLHPAGLKHLTVVGRDSRGQFHWFHPSAKTLDVATSIAIASDVARQEIPEAVGLPLPLGPIVIVAVFSRESISRKRLEAWLSAEALSSNPGPLENTALDIHRLVVVPPQD